MFLHKRLHSGMIYLDRFSSKDKKGLGALRQEPREFVDQDMLDLIRLFDLDADAYAVDARLNEHSFVFVARYRQRVHDDLRRALGLDLGYIMSLGDLRWEVGKR